MKVQTVILKNRSLSIPQTSQWMDIRGTATPPGKVGFFIITDQHERKRKRTQRHKLLQFHVIFLNVSPSLWVHICDTNYGLLPQSKSLIVLPARVHTHILSSSCPLVVYPACNEKSEYRYTHSGAPHFQNTHTQIFKDT